MHPRNVGASNSSRPVSKSVIKGMDATIGAGRSARINAQEEIGKYLKDEETDPDNCYKRGLLYRVHNG